MPPGRTLVLAGAAATLGSGPAPAGELCFALSSAAAADFRNVTVECGHLDLHDNVWVGFSSTGDPPCGTEDFCARVPGYDESSYGWSLSASSTDPYAHRGAVDGEATIYLWFVCSPTARDGMSAAAFDLTGTIDVLALTPRNGYLNAGTPTSPLLAVGGCPRGPVVAAQVLVIEPSPVEETTWARIKRRYR